MPRNPEPEGSPRLITPQQIEQEHGIKRSTLYTYRHRPSFPQPVKVEGSIKTFYRADEVAAWLAANPKEQGKRTDLAAKQQGDPVVSDTQSGARRDDDRDREQLLDTAVLVEARWPGEYSALCRDLRDLADVIAEESQDG